MTKTVFITGGSRGIGEAIVRLMAGKYNVAFTYHKSRERAEALEAELNSRFGGVLAIPCDVSDENSVRTAFAAARKRFLDVDVLVNNAGVAYSGLLSDMTADEWRGVMAVNLDGAFFAIKEALPYMLKKGEGCIINVSSIWGVDGASCEAAYSASKAALIGLTKALAKEVGPMGVRVNAVAPGAIDTDMMHCYTPAETSAFLAENVPLGRLGTPAEVAAGVEYLIDAGGFCNGTILTIAG